MLHALQHAMEDGRDSVEERDIAAVRKEVIGKVKK